MDIKEFEAILPDFILGMLSEEKEATLLEFVKDNPAAAKMYREWTPIKDEFEYEVEGPSEEQDARFMEYLHSTASENEKKPSWFEIWFPRGSKQVIGFASLASIILVVGFLSGSYFNDGEMDQKSTELATEALQEATQETDAVRTQLVISLADQPSATKRLEALSEVGKLNEATDKVIKALFKMLNDDTNVNVRLAAVTSLSKYVENPKVREGLVLSITQQDSPLVQIALAELMVTLKEQKSINSMESLLQRPGTNEAVKQKLEESIKQII